MKVLVRLGELTLKSDRSRRRFLRALIHNISDALRSEGYENFLIRNMWSRLLIEVDGDDLPSVLRRVFGIISYSPVVHSRDIWRSAYRNGGSCNISFVWWFRFRCG